MRAEIKRMAGVAIGVLSCAGGVALAAASDVRLVNAEAEQDRAAVRALLREGVDVNAARADGATALLWASHWDDVQTADLLLKAGARVNAADDHGVTPLAQASVNASQRMVDKLLAAGADPNLAQSSGLTPLMIAAKTGSVGVARALLARGANVNASTVQTRETALMWAAAEQHRDVAAVLTEARADVHASSAKGFTALMYAARNGDLAMGRLLVAAGADVNEAGSDGSHVLPFALVGGQADFALFLLEQGADPNGDLGGVRALHAAAGPVDAWLGDWFRQHTGAAPVVPRVLPLDRRVALVKALVARGADPNARITTSAMLMNYIGYPKKGAFEPFACGTGDLRGATPMWVAAYAANAEFGNQTIVPPAPTPRDASVIRALLSAGADHRLTTDDGTTPLMAAAGLGRATYTPRRPRGERSESAEEAVKVLLEAGADINAANEADFTALHGAAMRGLDEVVTFLVAHGADVNARDFRGRTPYRLAQGSKQSFQFQDWPETAAVLEKLGADPRLGIPGTVQERLRDVPAAAAQQP